MLTKNHLLRTCYLLFKFDNHRQTLRPVYKKPFRMLEKHNKYFVLDLLSETVRVSDNHLKSSSFKCGYPNQSVSSHRVNSPGSNFLVGSLPRYPPATVSSPHQHVLSSNQDTAETSRPGTTSRGCQMNKPSYLNYYNA